MTFVNASSITGASANVTCPMPSGAQVGDTVLAFHTNDFGTYVGMTANAAFTFQGGYDGGSSGVKARCYSRIIDGSEAASYQFTNSTSAETVVQMALFTGVTLTGFTSNFGSTPSGDNQWTCPSLSPGTGDGDLVCYVAYGTDNVSNTFTPPTGMTERGDHQSGTWISASHASLGAPGTPTSSRTFTSTQTISWASPATGAAFSIYLPSSGPPPPAAEESFYSSAMDAMTAYM